MEAATTADLTLDQALGPGRHLRAICWTPSCGRSSPLDPTHWLAIGLGGAPLRSFSWRLRCVCGARQGGVEVWRGQAETSAPFGLYAFH